MPAPMLVTEPAPVPDYPTGQFIRSADATAGLVRNRYYLGAQVFYDNYEEPDAFPDLHEDSYYGAVTAGVTHYFSPHLFGTAEGRLSYGQSDYYSSQGHISGTPQWESEGRLLAGYDARVGQSHLKPYTGIATRYFFDNGKGETTDQGVYAYDRRIWQLYVPIGVTYEWMADGLTFAPTIEADRLIYGNVKSQLGEIPGYPDLNNQQYDGWGWRGSIMISKLHDNGTGWQFGPFFRYWGVQDSSKGIGGSYEPHNQRIQIGTDFRYLF
ncbi:MAG: hypothetical protein B7X02_01300 [Rhodospirillales bacterium 12-54-5]|nr:MAG: hypothetical protein B7X02_01300 [Rhodospirillales bacterium 12-54-5]